MMPWTAPTGTLTAVDQTRRMMPTVRHRMRGRVCEETFLGSVVPERGSDIHVPLVAFQGRGCTDVVQLDLCHLLLETLLFQWP